MHGQPPIVLRIWEQPGRMTVTVTVTDTGTGRVRPFRFGLLPPTGSNGGLGLWISHQLVDITHRPHPGGYTIRLTAARPAP